MYRRLPTSLPTSATPSDLLDSWKEIARYLNRDIRTIQRWEHTKGLPVHRLPGGQKTGSLRLEIGSGRVAPA